MNTSQMKRKFDLLKCEITENGGKETASGQDEIRGIIENLKNDKTARLHDITAKIISYGDKILFTKLYELIKRIWKKENIWL